MSSHYGHRQREQVRRGGCQQRRIGISSVRTYEIVNRPTGTVTFLFTDVEASTRLWETYPEAMKDALAKHDRVVRSAIEEHDGVVFTTAGDAFCAAFSVPQQALNAALDTQLGLAAEDWGILGDLRVKAALHTGNADERDGDYFGPPLNRCARLLSTGYGGQILVSSATANLVQDNLAAGIGLKDLGAHNLKDLERPEHVFQVMYKGLTSAFPELRSERPVLDAAEQVATGRQSHASQQWEPAYVALAAAAKAIDLEAEDLQRLGEAAFWTGRSDEGIAIREKTFGLYSREGKREAAALIALALADSYKYRLAKAVSRAWVARAESLINDLPQSEAYGYLLRWKSVASFETEGDSEKAVALAEEVIALGTELKNQSLRALGLQDKGRFLVAMGQVDEGMTLIDEAMVAAVSGELSPDATGRSYCNMLTVCDQVADYQRATEWSDAAQAWCEQHSDSAYPGVCRIVRAELKWLRGDWETATAELDRALTELHGFTLVVGSALYQKGEVELRAGHLTEAEDLFRSAHEHGYPVLPGLAELRLAQGDSEAASQLLSDAFRTDHLGPLARAKYLPALIDTQLSLGHIDEAKASITELEGVAGSCDSSAMRSSALHRRAVISLREGRTADAIEELREAIRRRNELQMPYETAQSRLLLAEAQHEAGFDSAARLELFSAKSAFTSLGANIDIERVEALIGG